MSDTLPVFLNFFPVASIKISNNYTWNDRQHKFDTRQWLTKIAFVPQLNTQSVIGLHATKNVAVIDINVILPDTTWLVILDLTTIRGTVTSTQTRKRSVQVQCMAWFFYFYCPLDNHFHFKLNMREVSTCPGFGLSSTFAAH